MTFGLEQLADGREKAVITLYIPDEYFRRVVLEFSLDGFAAMANKLPVIMRMMQKEENCKRFFLSSGVYAYIFFYGDSGPRAILYEGILVRGKVEMNFDLRAMPCTWRMVDFLLDQHFAMKTRFRHYKDIQLCHHVEYEHYYCHLCMPLTYKDAKNAKPF